MKINDFVKLCLACFFCCCWCSVVINAQAFSTTTPLPFNLELGTSYSSCASPGTKAFSFSVSGVGVLNNTDNQLAEIRITLDATCGSNIRDVACYIKSPTGICMRIASQMGTTTSYSISPQNQVDYYFRNSTSCLNKIPDYANSPSTTPAANGTNGQFGIFSTDGDMSTSFNGINADGTWTIYFWESTSFEPCLTSAELVFGDPQHQNFAGQGNTCATAIPWDGGPFCATSAGMTPTTNTPGFNPTYTSSFGCDWNASNDNTVWIQIIPTQPDVCVNISGMTDNQQSIIVEDSNTDGDNNPCTGLNGGLYWDIVSCPRTGDAIYGASTGTTRNQTHCFTAVPGEEYFLVIDGNGGATSDFYVTGISGLPVILPVTLTSFTTTCHDNQTTLQWETATELNNHYYTLERSTDGANWRTVATVTGNGTTNSPSFYQWTDSEINYGIHYYRLKQTDYDGQFEVLKVIASNCGINADGVSVLPNPNNGQFTITGLEEGADVQIVNIMGQVVYEETATTNFSVIELTGQPRGIYYIRTQNNHRQTTTKFIIE